jgi:hypothetical protein
MIIIFSIQFLSGENTIDMGIKKAQAPSHISSQACDSPKYTMVEVCAMVRSSNVYLDLLIKSRSRSQFDWIIEQQKVAIVNCVAKILTFHENCSRKMLFLVIFTDLIFKRR